MSLINQMLRDLEERKRESTPDDSAVSVPARRRSRAPSIQIVLVILLAMGLAAGIGLWFGHRLGNTPATTRQTNTAPVSHPETRSNAAISAQAHDLKSPVTQAVQGPRLASLQLIESDGRQGLDLHLSSAAHFEFHEQQDPARWILTLEGVKNAPANLAAATMPHPVQSFSYNLTDDSLVMVFGLAASTPAEAQAISATELKLWFGQAPEPKPIPRPVASSPVPAAAKPARPAAPEQKMVGTHQEMIKIPRKPSPQEQAEQDYQDALSAVRAGELSTATKALNHALEVKSGYVPARLLLARIYLKQGDKTAAETLLKDGIAAAENAQDRAQLADLYARMLVDDGHLDKAIKLLESIQPALDKAPEHYALLAALEQRANAHDKAASLYGRLVELDPGSGVWWMGLGLSLEQLRQPAKALQAYQRAAATGSLEPDIQKFVEGRIAALSQ